MTYTELIELVGQEAFDKLSSVFGGKQIRVSGTPESINRFAHVIGLEKAEILCERFKGGELIYIAKKSRDELAIRDKKIIQEYIDGKSVEYLAEEYLLSDRQIWSILKKPH